jgi:hypothetical protein
VVPSSLPLGIAASQLQKVLSGLSIFEPFRASNWWEHKLSPILATLYATAALSHIPFTSLWPTVGIALLALIPCATYVSVLNDLTDTEDDRASGKLNRLSGKPRVFPASLITCCLAVGLGFLILWRKDALVFYSYVFAWLAFTLYSTPPFRLKVRGIWGVLADASGAHLFPTLFAIALVYHWHGISVVIRWTAVAGLWSLAAGVRGILWHQLSDAGSDAKIGLRTFVCLHDVKHIERLGLFAFLVETAAYATMLWLTRSLLAGLFLILYGLFALTRERLLGIRLTIVTPGSKFRMALAEYYIVLYPLAYLLAASWRQPAVLFLLAFHFLLFPRHCVFLARDSRALLQAATASPEQKLPA